jgi:hypothetical protein
MERSPVAHSDLMISLSRTTIFWTALVITLLPRLAGAQTVIPFEISAAYTYVRDPSIDVTFPAGWSVGVAKGVNSWLSIAAAYDDARTTTSTFVGDLRSGIRTTMAGGKASAKLGRFTEFGQLLVGVGHESGSGFGVTVSSNHFCTQAGAGVDAPLSSKVAIRVELDYRVFGVHRGGELARQVRGVAGIVISSF